MVSILIYSIQISEEYFFIEGVELCNFLNMIRPCLFGRHISSLQLLEREYMNFLQQWGFVRGGVFPISIGLLLGSAKNHSVFYFVF